MSIAGASCRPGSPQQRQNPPGRITETSPPAEPAEGRQDGPPRNHPGSRQNPPKSSLQRHRGGRRTRCSLYYCDGPGQSGQHCGQRAGEPEEDRGEAQGDGKCHQDHTDRHAKACPGSRQYGLHCEQVTGENPQSQLHHEGGAGPRGAAEHQRAEGGSQTTGDAEEKQIPGCNLSGNREPNFV